MNRSHKISASLLEKLKASLPLKGEKLPPNLSINDAIWDSCVQGDYDWIVLHALYALKDTATQEEIKRLKAVSAKLLKALVAARSHLEYCGYGDSWERECADASKLPEALDKAVKLGKGIR